MRTHRPAPVLLRRPVAWLRQLWVDPRLSYDYQCFGGMDAIEIQASAGQNENTFIWTPDIEMYNHKQPIWGESVLGVRNAIIYSCWDGAPTRGGCVSANCKHIMSACVPALIVWFPSRVILCAGQGEVFWSRPGVMTALCRDL